MQPANVLLQYPPLIQSTRHGDTLHHDHERETIPYRLRNGGNHDDSRSPVTAKDFQDQHRGPARRPSTPNLDRSLPRVRTGSAPPLPDPQHRYKHHPPRNE